jgi:hypothetical protein
MASKYQPFKWETMNRRPPKNGEKIEKKINILLVDGNALFKRSFPLLLILLLYLYINNIKL